MILGDGAGCYKGFSMMNIEIDEGVVRATTRCNDHFSCLSGDLARLCKVEDCVSDAVYFVKCVEETDCNYKVPFGDGQVCTCPTRKEIYFRYKM